MADDFYKFIPAVGGIVDIFSGLFGGRNNSGNRIAERQLQLQEQALKQQQELQQQILQNYNKYAGEAAGYRQNAAGMVPQMQQWGLQDRTSGVENLYDMLDVFSNASGLGQQFARPYNVSTGAPGAPDNRTTPGTGGTAQGAQGPPKAVKPLQMPDPNSPANPNLPGPHPAQGPQQTAGQYYGTSGQPGQDMYQITPAQQQQLNQRVDRYNQAAESAIAEYRANAAARGMQANPAQEAQIRATFSQMGEEEKARFAESAREERAQGALNLAQLFDSITRGGQTQFQNAAGLLGNLSDSALGQANGGPLASLFGAAGNQAGNALQGQVAGLQMQNASDRDFGEWLAGIGEIMGYLSNLGGKKAGTPPIVPESGIPLAFRGFSGLA